MKLNLPIHGYRHWLVPGLLTGLLFAALVMSFAPPSGGAGTWRQFNAVVHWRGAVNDWLFVIDHQTGGVAVYDATDGRPLCRLGSVADGALKPCSRDLLEAGGGQGDFRLPLSSQQAASGTRR